MPTFPPSDLESLSSEGITLLEGEVLGAKEPQGYGKGVEGQGRYKSAASRGR